jgi:mannonate dehydratase
VWPRWAGADSRPCSPRRPYMDLKMHQDWYMVRSMAEMDPTSRTEPPWVAASTVRIRDVRVVLTAPQGVTLVVVKVETTEPGLYGLGCATFTQRWAAVATTIESFLKPFAIGRDPADIEDIVRGAHLSSYWRTGPVLLNALSGIDMALWDIKGKVAGLPLYQLFGGRARTALPAYAHADGRDPAEVADQVRAFMAAGFGHVRAQVAVPGSDTYGAGGASGAPWRPRAYGRLVPTLFDHLRENLGEEVELIHDVHERLDPTDAIRLAKDLEPHRLFFLEDALAPEDLAHLPRLRGATTTPLALGELFVSPAEYLDPVRNGLIDYIRVHLSAIGGITPARKLTAIAEASGVRTAFHGPMDCSPVGHAANLHVGLAAPNFGIHEQNALDDATREVFPGAPEIRSGMLWSNERPGLGVDLDENAAAAYPPVEGPLNGSWSPVRLADGSIARP